MQGADYYLCVSDLFPGKTRTKWLSQEFLEPCRQWFSVSEITDGGRDGAPADLPTYNLSASQYFGLINQLWTCRHRSARVIILSRAQAEKNSPKMRVVLLQGRGHTAQQGTGAAGPLGRVPAVLNQPAISTAFGGRAQHIGTPQDQAAHRHTTGPGCSPPEDGNGF